MDPRRRPTPPPPPPPPEEQQQQQQQQQQQKQQQQQQTHMQEQEQGSQPTADSTEQPQKEQQKKDGKEEGGFKLKFCTVCASNNNRSMEAHLQLTKPDKGTYPTISFGTGSLVRLPGPSITQPNVYQFNSTSYAAMYDQLQSKDERLYRANGILNMLERNKNVKWGPERWQDWRVGVPRVGKRWENADFSEDHGYKGTEAGTVDIVITCEERCWDAVVEDLLARGAPLNRPVHVFNVDIKDNHEEALVGGKAIRELADMLNKAAQEERDGWVKGGGAVDGFDEGGAGARAGFDERVPDLLAEWQDRWPGLPALWTLSWF